MTKIPWFFSLSILSVISIFVLGYSVHADYIPPAKFLVTDHGNIDSFTHDTAWNTKGIGETLLETNGYLKSIDLKLDKIIKKLDTPTSNVTKQDVKEIKKIITWRDLKK